MIEIVCKETLYAYDAYHIVKSFFPEAEITQKIKEEQEPLVSVEIEGGSSFCVCRKDGEKSKTETKASVGKELYHQLEKIKGQGLPWGILTGVRPTKLVMGELEKGKKDQEAATWMEDRFLVSEEKAGLSVEIAKREKQLLEQLDYKNGYSLYVGIPFCPSICAYCSFSSSPIALWEDKTDRYLEALLKELVFVARVSGEKVLDTVYVGGGTPTTLRADQLDRLLTQLETSFDYSTVKEVTVEAGRPDSITEEKLEVLQRHHVTRISVNPQTMQQKTLDLVGRKHTVEAVEEVFLKARSLGFDNINMDLIAGLPGEDAKDMEETLKRVEALRPDSLTIHSLAIKRAAKYGQNPIRQIDAAEMTKMIDLGETYARKMDLVPYYLYRQKNMAGNFENVGYAKVDKAGIYNILIMEEKQSIVACGAGASTKIVLPKPLEGKDGKKVGIVRVENVKNILEYIDRIDEMIERKEEWLWR